MDITRKSVAKIGIKDIERAWKDRAKGARIILTDRACPGLELITNANSQSWVRPYRLRGVDPTTDKRFPMTAARLGSPSTLSPDQARAEANRIKDVVAAGGDPGANLKATISKAALERASTVERAVADYLAALPTKGKKGGGRISEAWTREQANHLHRAVAALGVAASPVESVDARTVRRLQHGDAYRHRFGALNRFFDWCVHEGRIAANPAASIGRAYRPTAGSQRERTPSLKELALVWPAAGTALEPVFRDFVRFALTTPARRGEIANLRWEHLDLNDRVWRQPSKLTKNRDAHELQLNPIALEILTRRWETAGRPKAGLVFPAPRSMKPITAFSGVLRALHRATPGMAPWALHDLRRSFATTLGRLGQDDEATIDAVLNYRQSATRGGVLGVYNKSTRLPAQAEALERWGALLADALEGRFPAEAEVIPLAQRVRA